MLFVAFYLRPQNEAGTKTALNQLYKARSKKENAHPEAALIVAGDFNAGKLKSFLPNLQTEKKNPRPPLLHTQKCVCVSTSMEQ